GAGVRMFLMPLTSTRTGRFAIGSPIASRIVIQIVTLSAASATTVAGPAPFRVTSTLDSAALGEGALLAAGRDAQEAWPYADSDRASTAATGRRRIRGARPWRTRH